MKRQVQDNLLFMAGFTAVSIGFAIMKLTNVIAWSWAWVTAPLRVPLAVLFVILLILMVLDVAFPRACRNCGHALSEHAAKGCAHRDAHDLRCFCTKPAPRQAVSFPA